MEKVRLERFNKRDITQIFVGSLIGSLTFFFGSPVDQLALRITFFHFPIIITLSFITSYATSYSIGVRELGEKKKRKFLYIPIRCWIHVSFSFFTSFLVLYIFGSITFSESLDLILRKIMILTLPSTFAGSATDLIKSQKAKD